MKWIQLDLFTGEPISYQPPVISKQERMAKTTRLALDVQFLIVRLDKLTDPMKIDSELCEQITGIAYPIDIDERHRTYQQKRQQNHNQAIAAEMQKPTRKKRSKQKPNQRQRETHQRLFLNKKGAKS